MIADAALTDTVWRLGRHRLMCGDCTDADAVHRLFDGGTADLCVTSPPYFNQRPEYTSWPDYRSYRDFVDRSIESILRVAGEPFALCWNVGDDQSRKIPMIADQTLQLRDAGLTYLDTLIWRKPCANYTIPRSAHIRTTNHYYPALRYEAIVVLRKGKRMPRFDASDADAVSRFGTNVWDMPFVNNSTQGRVGHPAMFPVDLPERCIRAYSTSGATVYDPFGGSGTTIVAAERTGRTCYAMEARLDYCIAAVRRWEEETGSAASTR